MSERMYIVIDTTTNNEELAYGVSQRGAIGLVNEGRFTARPAKPEDVARLYDSGKRPLRVKEGGEPE